ncbi:MAG: BamA/TamA family outer membrane protein, partial [Bacteroidales bacterium]
YVGYTVAGYDVFVLPIDRARWTQIPDVAREPDHQTKDHPTTDHPTNDHETTDHPYSPLPTILPRFWLPAFEASDGQLRVGAQTGGTDVLGRHVYTASALWRVAGRAEAPGSPRDDWAVSYVYDRWLPSVFASVSDRTHFLQEVALTDGRVVNADVREQNEQVGVILPDLHARYAHALSASLLLQRQTINIGGLAARDSSRNGIRLAWTFSNAHTYAYSISPEQGITIGVTGEMVRQALGALASSDAATVDGRGYLRLGGQHRVLAARAAFGAGWGDPRTARRFYLGGSGGNTDPASFDSDALNLLRGFDLNAFAGDRLAVFNAEYRVPLLRVNRGQGTFPVFLRTLHITGFFDAGKAWRDGQPVPPFAMSVGGELAATWRLGYQLPLLVAGGIAWPRPPGAGEFASPTGYVRVGYAF